MQSQIDKGIQANQCHSINSRTRPHTLQLPREHLTEESSVSH